MSQRLPRISGHTVVRLLETMGYVAIRQRGSHLRLRKETRVGEHDITVPVHRAMAIGTLSDILTEISLWNNIPKEELIRALREL